jgi:ribosome-associated heat shock protein Hsp15
MEDFKIPAVYQPTRVRIDKWLWAARFFKTRALAAHACELGRIHSGGLQAKASREVRPGDQLKIRNDSGDYEIEVLVAAENRAGAAIAQTFYQESDSSREKRQQQALERKAMSGIDLWADGRPNKRDRREIARFRGR